MLYWLSYLYQWFYKIISAELIPSKSLRGINFLEILKMRGF